MILERPWVAGHEGHAGQAVKISAAPREHNRVIINVGDSRARVMLSGKLMDITSGGEAGSYVNELRDTGLCGKEADRVLEEFPVLQGGQRDIGRGPEHQAGRFPVSPRILVSAEVVIPHPRDARDGLVNAGRLCLIGHMVLLLSGHPGDARLPGTGSAAGASISRWRCAHRPSAVLPG
jgi:hypothetical protein